VLAAAVGAIGMSFGCTGFCRWVYCVKYWICCWSAGWSGAVVPFFGVEVMAVVASVFLLIELVWFCITFSPYVEVVF
jgi:hypothetical protein